jgi:transcriptional regulator with XRE-family HTH domain
MIASMQAVGGQALPRCPPRAGPLYDDVLTPAQIRAARALLGWRQLDLARASGISEISIKNIERGATDPRRSTLLAIQTALERAGVEFIDQSQPSAGGGEGVRLRGQP